MTLPSNEPKPDVQNQFVVNHCFKIKVWNWQSKREQLREGEWMHPSVAIAKHHRKFLRFVYTAVAHLYLLG